MQNEAESILNLLHEGQDEIEQRIPGVLENFKGFAQSVTKEGLLTPKFKELIAVAVAVSIRCQPCIINHVKRALDEGATADEILEACSVAFMMGGGPSIAYTSYVVKALKDFGTLGSGEQKGGC